MTEPKDSKKTILVVEDDLDFSAFVTTVLADHGYRTAVVVNGAEALERAKALRPEGITLDILLPGRTGIAIYRALRKDETTRGIPVVIVTGVGTEGKKLAVERFFRGRALPPPEAVLQKPVEPHEVVEPCPV